MDIPCRSLLLAATLVALSSSIAGFPQGCCPSCCSQAELTTEVTLLRATVYPPGDDCDEYDLDVYSGYDQDDSDQADEVMRSAGKRHHSGKDKIGSGKGEAKAATGGKRAVKGGGKGGGGQTGGGKGGGGRGGSGQTGGGKGGSGQVGGGKGSGGGKGGGGQAGSGKGDGGKGGGGKGGGGKGGSGQSGGGGKGGGAKGNDSKTEVNGSAGNKGIGSVLAGALSSVGSVTIDQVKTGVETLTATVNLAQAIKGFVKDSDRDNEKETREPPREEKFVQETMQMNPRPIGQ